MVKRCGCGYPFSVRNVEAKGHTWPMAELLDKAGHEVVAAAWLCPNCGAWLTGSELRDDLGLHGTPWCPGYTTAGPLRPENQEG